MFKTRSVYHKKGTEFADSYIVALRHLGSLLLKKRREK